MAELRAKGVAFQMAEEATAAERQVSGMARLTDPASLDAPHAGQTHMCLEANDLDDAGGELLGPDFVLQSPSESGVWGHKLLKKGWAPTVRRLDTA